MATRRPDPVRWLSSTALCLGIACSNHVPSALSLPPDDAAAQAVHVVDRASALAASLRGDPFARRPRFPDPSVLDRLEHVDALRDVATTLAGLERARGDLSAGAATLAARWPGTEAEALSWGYRLGLAERRLGAVTGAPDADTMQAVTRILTPLPSVQTEVRHTASALDGLAPRREDLPDAVRAAGERAVLRHWLAGPDIPLAPVAAALEAPAHSRWRSARIGRLLAARAHPDPTVPPHSPEGFDRLREATGLALVRAAADRASEQGAWADQRRAAQETTQAEAPVAALLMQAFERFTPHAVHPDAVGGALIALEALRLENACDVPPCAGLYDRVQGIRDARAWSEATADLVATWQVIALKEALDALEVGQGTVRHRAAVAEMVDALLGTGGTPPPAHILAESGPSPGLWAALAASVGEDGAATWQDARLALGSHLAERAAIARSVAPPAWHEPLDRIRRRALP